MVAIVPMTALKMAAAERSGRRWLTGKVMSKLNISSEASNGIPAGAFRQGKLASARSPASRRQGDTILTLPVLYRLNWLSYKPNELSPAS
jgi:hypothetical protein